MIAEDYELAVQRTRTRRWDYDRGALLREDAEARLWVSLRVLNRKQPGRAVMAVETTDSLPQLVEMAFESSRLASPDPWFRFPIWKPLRTEGARKDEPEPVFSSLQSVFPVSALRESYECRDEDLRLVRKTERAQLQHQRRVHSLTFRLDDGWWEHRAQTRPLLQRERWLGQLVEKARVGAAGEPLKGPAPRGIWMRPAAVTPILAQTAPWFYGDRIHDGKSPLSFPPRDSLFSSAVSLVDDGLLDGGSETMPFDYEGVAAQETLLVDRGNFRNVLLDTYSATRENRLGTGSFRREPDSPYPRVMPSHFYVKAASSPLPVASGIVLETASHVESHDDQILLVGRGWRAEGGRFVAPVQGVRIRCSLFDLWRRAAAVGNDLSFFGSWGSPSIFFENLPLDI